MENWGLQLGRGLILGATMSILFLYPAFSIIFCTVLNDTDTLHDIISPIDLDLVVKTLYKNLEVV